MLRRFAPLALGLLLAVPTVELSLEPEENNLAQGRLNGTWEFAPVVSEKLGATSHEGTTLEFREDATVLASLPGMWDRPLADFVLYEAGHYTYRDEGEVRFSGPYVLTNAAGNPHLITFRAANGEPLTDAESNNLLVAPGKEASQDLLFLGGDFDNEPLRAFRRAEKGD